MYDLNVTLALLFSAVQLLHIFRSNTEQPTEPKPRTKYEIGFRNMMLGHSIMQSNIKNHH